MYKVYIFDATNEKYPGMTIFWYNFLSEVLRNKQHHELFPDAIDKELSKFNGTLDSKSPFVKFKKEEDVLTFLLTWA